MPQFRDPTTGGDKLPLDELKGSLLLFSVHEQMGEMQTSFGPATPIRADVAVLDGARKGEAFTDALIFPRVLQGNLRGAIGEMVIGRLGKGQAKAGQSQPWLLEAATDADKAVGEKYLAYAEAKAAADEEPFLDIGDRGDMTFRDMHRFV
jgi:hypothetical protein